MNLSVSNIGWNVCDDHKVLKLLKEYRINAIDIAPTLYFKDISKTTLKDILRVKEWWLNRGIKIVGMQALMYGKPELNLFGDNSVQKKMLAHIKKMCQIGSILDAKKHL